MEKCQDAFLSMNEGGSLSAIGSKGCWDCVQGKARFHSFVSFTGSLEIQKQKPSVKSSAVGWLVLLLLLLGRGDRKNEERICYWMLLCGRVWSFGLSVSFGSFYCS